MKIKYCGVDIESHEELVALSTDESLYQARWDARHVEGKTDAAARPNEGKVMTYDKVDEEHLDVIRRMASSAMDLL